MLDLTGSSRRSFLRAGTLALGGLTLADLMRASASSPEADFVRDKAVVLVFLAGGASHIETFNPNMDGPEASRSLTGEVKSSLPGVTLGGTFPALAKHAHRMTFVRNFRHPVGDHARAIAHVLSGGTDPTGAGERGYGMNAVYSRIRGTNHPKTGLPTSHLLSNPHKDPQYARELQRVEVGCKSGSLGPSFAPFVLGVSAQPPAATKPGKTPPAKPGPLDDMRMKIPAERLKDRQALLRTIDGLRHGLDADDTRAGFDRFGQQALDLLLGGASRAFDLTSESEATRKKYDTSSFKCGKKLFEPSMLGRQFLLARRLVEAGAGFVTIQSAGWDMHADGNNPGVKDGMEMLGRPLDHALSAFLDDLDDRGMQDKVAVIVTGDFGRTPKVNAKGGRDHWANLCTLALAGCLGVGKVVGRCDRNNAKPDGPETTTANLMATVLHTVFDPGVLRVARSVPGNLAKLAEDHKPIG